MRTVLVLVLAGCGRLAFDARGDGGGIDPTGDGAQPHDGLATDGVPSDGTLADGTIDGPVPMPLFVVANSEDVTGISPSRTIVNQQAGDTLIVGVGWTGSPTNTVCHDTAGDTFVAPSIATPAGALNSYLCYVPSAVAAASNTVTVSLTANPSEANMILAQYRNLGTYDNYGHVDDLGSPTLTAGVTTTQPLEFVVAYAVALNNVNNASGYTMRAGSPGAMVRGSILLDGVQATPGTASVSVSVTASAPSAMWLLAFKP